MPMIMPIRDLRKTSEISELAHKNKEPLVPVQRRQFPFRPVEKAEHILPLRQESAVFYIRHLHGEQPLPCSKKLYIRIIKSFM